MADTHTAEPHPAWPEGTPKPAGRVLVTGATGFVGGRLSRSLIAEGMTVRGIGRSLTAGLALAAEGVEFMPVDLRDRAAVVTACRDVELVAHVGALSSAWGRDEDFHAINVGGTENVIAGCLAHGVRRLVYVSSPSVMSRFAAQRDLDEDAPLPDRFVSVYSETKKLGEDRVLLASRTDDRGLPPLETVILRPKAIYGPGDTALLPRLLDAARRGRLPIVGDGETLTNLTHVDDVVHAICLALSRPGIAGRTYLITGGEDVRLWDLVAEVTAALGYPPPSRHIPVARALAIGGVLETLYRWLPLPGEPPLTRYKAGILGQSQTYDIRRARVELGYEPRVRLDDGLREVVATARAAQSATQSNSMAWASRGRGPSGDGIAAAAGGADGPTSKRRASREPEVQVELLRSGYVEQLEALVVPGGAHRRVAIPAMFALIEHAREGIVLFDTGYTPRFLEATRTLPHRLYRIATPVRIDPAETAKNQLLERGIDPKEVRWIVLSHFDPDHYGGLLDFPNARIVCHHRAFAATVGKTGLGALLMRLLPGHLPDDMAARVRLLPDADGQARGPFAHTHDLFGDGSLRLVELPGHAPGQVGMFLRARSAGQMLLAADAVFSRAALGDPAGAMPNRGGVHRLIAHDRTALDQTYGALRALMRAEPDTCLVPSHCPQTCAELVGAQPRLSIAAPRASA